MSYAKLKQSAQAFGSDQLSSDECREFYADLSDGLHALAQPLTILRASVGMIGYNHGKNSDRYIDLSMKEVERTCRLFRSLQALIATKLEPAMSGEIDLNRLAKRLVEESFSEFPGISIELSNRVWKPVYGDSERTEEAIAAMLEIATSVSPDGSATEVRPCQSEGFEGLIVEIKGKAKRLDAGGRLSLSLVKESILSQHGKYCFVSDPFCISIELPIRNPHGVIAPSVMRPSTRKTIFEEPIDQTDPNCTRGDHGPSSHSI